MNARCTLRVVPSAACWLACIRRAERPTPSRSPSPTSSTKGRSTSRKSPAAAGQELRGLPQRARRPRTRWCSKPRRDSQRGRFGPGGRGRQERRKPAAESRGPLGRTPSCRRPTTTSAPWRLTGEQLGLIKLWIDQGATGEVTGTRGPIQWQPLPPGMNPIYAVALDARRPVRRLRPGQSDLRLPRPLGPVGHATDRSGAGEVAACTANQGVAHLDLVQSLAFSPDGDLLASGGYREVKLWRTPARCAQGSTWPAARPDAGAGRQPRRQVGRHGRRQPARSSCGTWPSARTPRRLAGHTAAVTSLRFLPDGAQAGFRFARQDHSPVERGRWRGAGQARNARRRSMPWPLWPMARKWPPAAPTT